MKVGELEQNIEKMDAAIDYYKELLQTETHSKKAAENLKLKRDFTKEQILKFTLAVKRLLVEIEEKL